MSSGILGEAIIKEIQDIIERELTNKLEEYNKLTHEELKEIASSLVPDLDELVSKQVKKHFILLAQYALEKFGGNLDA